MSSGFMEGMFALSADLAIAWAFVFAGTGVAAAALGLYLLKVGRKADALRLLAFSVLVFVPAWLAYGKYQELLVKANGVATGPIYETVAWIVVLCLPVTLMLSLMFHRPKNDQKS